jgi:hypothetical protein
LFLLSRVRSVGGTFSALALRLCRPFHGKRHSMPCTYPCRVQLT